MSVSLFRGWVTVYMALGVGGANPPVIPAVPLLEKSIQKICGFDLTVLKSQ